MEIQIGLWDSFFFRRQKRLLRNLAGSGAEERLLRKYNQTTIMRNSSSSFPHKSLLYFKQVHKS